MSMTAGDSWVLTAPAPARLMVSASPEIETVRKSNGAFEALKKNMRIGRGYNNTNDHCHNDCMYDKYMITVIAVAMPTSSQITGFPHSGAISYAHWIVLLGRLHPKTGTVLRTKWVRVNMGIRKMDKNGSSNND